MSLPQTENRLIDDMAEFFDFTDILVLGNVEEELALFPIKYLDNGFGREELYDNESVNYPSADFRLHLMNIRSKKL